MVVTFVTESEPALDELRRDIAQHRRAGRVHVEFRRHDGPTDWPEAVADAFVKALAMRSPEAWTELYPHEALAAATRVLHVDLAYDSPVMAIDLARALAHRFVTCCGDGASFLTNGSLAQTKGNGTFFPLTDATFDAGVIAVSPKRIGLLWVEDED